jgi:hypothetical protein
MGFSTVLPTGEWMPVPNDKINNVLAPDGGAHVCAPRQVGPNKGVLCHSAVRGLRALRNVRYRSQSSGHFDGIAQKVGRIVRDAPLRAGFSLQFGR